MNNHVSAVQLHGLGCLCSAGESPAQLSARPGKELCSLPCMAVMWCGPLPHTGLYHVRVLSPPAIAVTSLLLCHCLGFCSDTWLPLGSHLTPGSHLLKHKAAKNWAAGKLWKGPRPFTTPLLHVCTTIAQTNFSANTWKFCLHPDFLTLTKLIFKSSLPNMKSLSHGMCRGN